MTTCEPVLSPEAELDDDAPSAGARAGELVPIVLLRDRLRHAGHAIVADARKLHPGR